MSASLQPTYTIAGLCILLVSPSSNPLTMSTDLQWLLVRKWNSFQVKGGHGPAFSKEKVSRGLDLRTPPGRGTGRAVGRLYCWGVRWIGNMEGMRWKWDALLRAASCRRGRERWS
jgi:hypothetical protein